MEDGNESKNSKKDIKKLWNEGKAIADAFLYALFQEKSLQPAKAPPKINDDLEELMPIYV